MGDPSIEQDSKGSETENGVNKSLDSENLSKIKLQLELSVKDDEHASQNKMSGKLFNTTAKRDNADNFCSLGTNNNNVAAVHLPNSVGGPEMTSTPSSEYEPHSLGGGNGYNGVVGSLRGNHSGINLHLDLRRCTDVTMAGHPLQKVVTPSPVTTPVQEVWNEVPLSTNPKQQPGTQLNRCQKVNKDVGFKEASDEKEDWCQCHLTEPKTSKNKPHIFTTQESVHEPTAGLKQYPNGQRYLCKSCRSELMSEQGRCPSCPPYSTDCSAFSSLESDGRRGFNACLAVSPGGIRPRETVISMPQPQQQQHCDLQNRENEHMVSYYADNYRQKDSKSKLRWLKKPCVLIPLCMLLCALLAVGTFYLLTYRTKQQQPPVTVMSKEEVNDTGSASGPLMRPLQQDQICVKCIHLKLSADPRDDFTKTLQKVPNPDDPENENEMQCCAQSASQLQQILDAIFETKTRQDQSFTVPRPVANTSAVYSTRNNLAVLLYLGEVTPTPAGGSPQGRKARPSSGASSPRQAVAASSEEEDNTPDTETPKIIYGWTNVTQSGAAYVRRNIIFDATRGRVKVTRTGLYKVYTKLSYQPELGKPSQGVFFTQKIMKENINLRLSGTVELLRDTQYLTCPNVATTHPCHSSSVNAVLYLRQEDEVFVEASHGNQIVRDKLSSYFGLYYID